LANAASGVAILESLLVSALEVMMSPLRLVELALAGFAGGAVFVVVVVFLALKFNYKQLRTAYSHIPQDGRFYQAWALLGGALGASYLVAMPLLDASGVKDPWYGLIMIAIGLVLFVPMVFFLRRRAR
jgi:hypothetical protein